MDKSRKLDLSSLDLVFCGQQPLPIQMLFSFEASPPDKERLRQALAESLEAYWPLKGKLKKERKDSVAVHEIPFEEIPLNFEGTETLIQPKSTFESPVSTFKWTILKNGGSLLGVSLSHAIVDGYSFFLFLSDWAARMRNEVTPAPQLDRKLLDFGSNPINEINPEELYRQTGLHWDANSDRVAIKPYQEIKISQSNLMSMRQEAEKDSSSRLSDNDLICAYLLKDFAKSSKEKIVGLTMPVDIRRITKVIGLLYFGNALRPVGLKLPREEILSLSLAELASRMSASVRQLRIELVEETYRYLDGVRSGMGLDAFEGMRVVDPNKGLLVTNLSRLPLEKIDFGFGAAQSVKLLTPMSGAAVILPSREGALIEWAR